MSPRPIVSVVIATYNWSSVLRYALESVLWQSFQDFEVIVIGDGCTDDSAAVVAAFGDPRLYWRNLPTNSGSQATPNNVGIAAARGRYIAYLGHDDVWMPDHLAALAQCLEATGCDLAVSGCAYHGPQGTDLLLITGLFEDPEDARRHFFPPTSFAHGLSLAVEIGGWRAPHTIPAPVDADFLLRAVEAGARFGTTGRVTAHKFAAGHRYLSYLEPSSAEQREMLAAIRSGTVDRQTCSDYVERAKAAGTFMVSANSVSPMFQPGDLYRWNRSNKGIDLVASVPLTEEVHVPQSMEPRALDWYPLEQGVGGSAPFRWSGPSLRPKLLIPFTGNLKARITLHLFDYDPAGIIDGVRLTLNGRAIWHRTHRDHPDQVDLDLTGRLRPDKPSVLELILPRAYCPAEVGGSSDRRRLGVILTGFTIAPTIEASMGACANEAIA